MDSKKILAEVLDNFNVVISQSSPLGSYLWQKLLTVHPADLAQLLTNIDRTRSKELLIALPRDLKLRVFYYLSDLMKVFCLSLLPEKERAYFLATLPLDELTDLFDALSDEELKRYLKLLHKQDREKVISLMKFDPESAGGLMHTDVLTLMKDFTIENSIKILQRIQPNKELHRIIYVTNQENELVGYINLEDLVLKTPKTRLESVLKKSIYVAKVGDDGEKVAKNMKRYKLENVPVISDENIFLGVIDTDALLDILEKEAAEDVYRISALPTIKQTYFETSFASLFYQRASILSVLLLVQIFSELVIRHYEILLAGFLIRFVTMIASTGGNTSSQTSALVIQGLVSGEITDNNMFRFLKREFMMAGAIGLTLGSVSFLRIYLTNPSTEKILSNFAVSLSLGAIVLASVMLGSVIPLILKKFKLDPALSAGPFLATLMDVLGILIYCSISRFILGI